MEDKVKEWVEKARGIILDEKMTYWEKIVPVRLNDLYLGMELGCTLEIGKFLNNDDFNGAKLAIENQNHSGMSFSLVCAMVSEFCKNGKAFSQIVR